MSRSTRPRRRFSTALALLTVLGITTGWSQPASSGYLAQLASRQVVTVGTAHAATDRSVAEDRSAALAAVLVQPAGAVAAGLVASVHVREEGARAAAASLVRPAAPVNAPTAKAKAAKPATYTGSNHFWIPSLGMSYGVHQYACSWQFIPKNLIYRWGCAGTNNVYIFGHAYGVMKPLHDLYVRGGLRKGMLAVYADSSGRIHRYRVTSWRVVEPGDSEWAIASQPVPSMTLQTCVGPDSKYRLNVRLVEVD